MTQSETPTARPSTTPAGAPSAGPGLPPRAGPSRRARAARLAGELVAWGSLLFVARFVAQGHLAFRMDQECHIGGIAVDVLAHGVRFPLAVYSPNEYDNGSFIQGLLASLGFAVVGPRVLVLRLVTHAFLTVGAVATMRLMHVALEELGWTEARQRWLATTVLVVAFALAPPLVTMRSMYGIGNHPEGSSIDVALLALFAARLHTRSAWRTFFFWSLVGFALYVNKGTLLALAVLGVAEVALGWRSRARLAAALGGFVAGLLPEIVVIVGRAGRGWETIFEKGERGARNFPQGMLTSLWTVSHHRVELLVLWGCALALGIALAWRSRSLAVRLAVGFALLHLAVLSVTARPFMDIYVLYGYPTIALLLGLLAVAATERVVARAGGRAAAWAAAGALGVVVLVHRPHSTSWGTAAVATLWNDRTGAVCSWRFAEGFGREYDHDLVPHDRSREEHVIARCRTLTDPTQITECMGGIGRELSWRFGRHVDGAPPASLNDVERHAYAYHYGTHRNGDTTDCADFREPELQATCAAATRLECLVYGDAYTRFMAGRPIGRPACSIDEPPDDAFWAAMRRDFLARDPGGRPVVPPFGGPDSLARCEATFVACYGE